MVQNMRAYLILYVIAIKWRICVQEEIELSSMSQEQGGAQPTFQEISP